MHVADLQRSVEFYQKMFGFSVVSQDQPGGIVRLGNGKVLVSVNNGKPAGVIDHFAIGVPRVRADAARSYLTQRGATVLRICRFANQGSRWAQRADFPDLID